MERFFEQFQQRLKYLDAKFMRSVMDEINWDARLIGIKGARGVGKTTLLLQYIQLHLSNRPCHQILYLSLDDIWFSCNLLVDLVSEFVRKGGKYLFLDDFIVIKGGLRN